MTLAGTLGAFPKFTFHFGLTGTRTLGDVGDSTKIVKDYQFGSEVNGGYTGFECYITEAEFLAGANVYKAWEIVQVKIASTETAPMIPDTGVWTGMIWPKPQRMSDGWVRIAAVGGSQIAKELFKTLLFRMDGPSFWMNRSTEEANLPDGAEGLDADPNGRLKFHVAPRAAYAVGNADGLVAIAEEALITKLTYVLRKHAHHPSWQLRARGFNAPLFEENESLMMHIGAHTLGSTGPANMSTITFDLPTAKNAVNLDIRCTGSPVKVSEGGDFVIRALTPRCYGLATTANYMASQVVGVVATNCDYDATGNVASTTPVLPLFWHRDNPLSALLDDMAVYEYRYWRVLGLNASNKFKLEFSPWTGTGTLSTTWFTTMAEIIQRDVQGSAEQFNQFKIGWRTVGGRWRVTTVNCDGVNGRPTDPFAGTARGLDRQPRVMPLDLDDVYPSAVVPTNYGDKLAKDFGREQFEGTITLYSARQTTSNGTEKPAPMILAGDWLTVTDWPGAGAGGTPGTRTFPIHHTNTVQDKTTLTVGRNPSKTEQLLARHLKKLARKGG